MVATSYLNEVRSSHSGLRSWLMSQMEIGEMMHMNLLEAYFKSASKMLSEGGEVHVTIREDPPYDSWNAVLLASKSRLTLKEKFALVVPKVVDHHYNKDEVHVLEMNSQIHDDEVQVLCENDTGDDHVDVLKIDEDHGQKHLKSSEDDDK
ncbi:hypothetical protein L1987_55492 [Smallanthus sonchifolius]|uniref:Uncharacterized protein n=1 Tax=Smallanthus sonchifolius TaxID=185202 RepID=A0ACB9EA76_9ASTR|nr:hypothetical protein L1987_55492 [Smallanthus sonchifolius]